MTPLLAAVGHIKAPHIDWASFSPLLALSVGALVVLMVGLLRPAVIRAAVVPALSVVTLGTSLGLQIWRFSHPASIISGALRIDGLALTLDMIFTVAALASVVISLRDAAPESAGHGEYHSLLLFSVLGMAVLVSAQDLITLFLGFELLSIPLYVMCASEWRREGSLESGLKYLVIGSVGSATLVYGLALVYGATGSTGFAGITHALSTGKIAGGLIGDPMMLTGLALVLVGFAFKASVAPFHQWTPDVYEGAPTPVTAFMATATKAAAFGILLRFFDVAVFDLRDTWAPALATVAAITIVVGNVGALGQSSLKRLLGYSSVAQAGYMLSGVVVATRLGVNATVLYLGVYLFMNVAAFAVIAGAQRERADGDDLAGLAGLGGRRPWLAWPMTIAMLALTGIPGTVGFIGKFQLIHALVDGNYTWLGIVLVIGSMISLGYYLRVIAAMWMSPESAASIPGRGRLAPIAGGSPEADATGVSEPPAAAAASPDATRSGPGIEITLVAVVFGAASVFFGIFPSPLFNLAAHAGRALGLH
ncbi:MAG: NADH-quinone oxidoreductase subunit [Solirubrobacteraceae bacterium]|jgi:NADH-quinone oxidoreductase subunit N|nr:NADH-quinone oxidoreductase subunit [Solirubrobacteraceae bacterium]